MVLVPGAVTIVMGEAAESPLLSAIGGAVLGAVLGFVSARAAAARDRRAITRKVARNLSQETRRIHVELGRQTSKVIDVDFGGLSFAVPSIHPWITALVPEAAAINGDVVGLFMTLDRELQNLKILLERHRGAREFWIAMGRPSSTDAAVDKAHRDCAVELTDAAGAYHETRTACFALLSKIDALLKPAL